MVYGMDACWIKTGIINLLTFLFALDIINCLAVKTGNNKVPEYCQHDTFNATCPQGMVIMMKSAQYGRMRLGRCLTRGYGSMGCAADVLEYVDTRCSGRTSCTMEVSDIPKQGYRPCSDDLSYYLEATYKCVKVETQPSCGMTHVLRPGSTSGYISSSLRGSQCPWSIRALPGQRLNITLFDFSIFKPAPPGEPIGSRGTSLVPSHSNNMQSLCKRYATIQEHSQRRETPICGGLNRVRSVFLSDGHKINVRVIDRSRTVVAGDAQSRFFLRYEAIGCPRVTAPINSRVTYNDKTMTVTCNTTGETWYLTCMDNEWVGTIANCTAQADSSVWTMLMVNWKSPYGILIIAGLGILFGVVLGVIMLILTVFLVKRYRSMCPCSSLEPSLEYHTHPNENKKNTMTSYSTAPQGLSGKTDVMLCDYEGKPWLSQRPLPEPGVTLDQQAELLAFCRDDDACETADIVYPTHPVAHPVAHPGYHTGSLRPVGSYGPQDRPCFVGHVYESPSLDRSDVL